MFGVWFIKSIWNLSSKPFISENFIDCLEVKKGFEFIIFPKTYFIKFQYPLIKFIYVSAGLDEADNWIESRCNKNSIVITDDIPLSKKCILLDALLINFRGKILDKENIGSIEASRNLMTSLREANNLIIQNNQNYTKLDRATFLQSLDYLIMKKL